LAPLSDPDGFAPGAESAGGSGAEAGLLNRGSSPEADGPFDLGALGALDPAGAFPDDGAALSGGLSFADGSRVNLGGPSLVSIPTGTGSAFAPFGSGSDPFGRNAPVPSQVAKAPGAELFLCSALDTVNNPSEFPARSASYTVPESSAIGTGSALYALVPELPIDQNRDRHQRCLVVRRHLQHSYSSWPGIFFPWGLSLSRDNLRPLLLRGRHNRAPSNPRDKRNQYCTAPRNSTL